VHHHPVHPRRRDGAGDRRRRRRADPRRGAGRHDLRAAGAARRAGGVRLVRELDVDADRRADLRHAGAGARALHDGRARPPAGGAVPLRRLADRSKPPTPRPPTRARTPCCRPSWPGSTSCCTPPAGWRAASSISYEKFVMDADQLGMMEVFAKGIDLSENGQALDAIREVGPGQPLPRQRPHPAPTSSPPSTAPTSPTTLSYEQWEEGSLDAASAPTRISRRSSRLRAPPLDPAIDEALQAFIARAQGRDARRASISGATPCCTSSHSSGPSHSRSRASPVVTVLGVVGRSRPRVCRTASAKAASFASPRRLTAAGMGFSASRTAAPESPPSSARRGRGGRGRSAADRVRSFQPLPFGIEEHR
jgi:hypothetical protein